MTAPDAVPNARQLRLLAILAATAAGLYLCYRLALPFLPAMTWALALAIVMVPLHRRVEARLGGADLPALVSVVGVLVAVAVPLLFLLRRLAREAASGAIYMQETIRSLDLEQALASYPSLRAAAAWLEEQVDPAGSLGALAEWLTAQSSLLLLGSLNQIVSFALTFYFLFYFLRDRDHAYRSIESLSPLGAAETAHVATRFVDAVHATVLGTLAVAAVQGTLGGLMFWWLGLPTPVFWGLVMGLLAVVPVLGAFVVWVPAVLYLAFEGSWVRAGLLAVWGGVVVAGIDNLLYPVLVGNRLRLHTVVAFIAAVGGIVLFDAAGLVLGPAAVAVTLALVEILKARFGTGPEPPSVERKN